MTQLRIMFVPAALAAFAATAHAQRWGGSPAAAAGTHASSGPVHQAARANGGSWNGTVSKWGGSPVQQRTAPRQRVVYASLAGAYIPVAVAVAAVPAVTYAADTTCPPVTVDETQPVEMQVVTATHAPRELTTIEVYRLQPRFQKP